MNSKKIFKIKKKSFMGLSITVIILSLLLVFGIKIINENEEKYDDKLLELNISSFRINEILNNNINNRKIVNIEDKIYVGENEKQIENGYYDICVYIQENKYLVISLNKLWKEFDEKLYQKEYVTEIAKSIESILDEDLNNEELFNYILSGYMIAKKSENIEEINKEYVLDLNDFVINGKILDKEFVISIYKK